jgi:catechol 2,3-dioxygenase-like lactoylglutathione lyase family enzyme
MIHGINHVAISTPDIVRLSAFYKDLLGFEEVFQLNWEIGDKTLDSITGLKDSSARIVMLKCGNACVELFEYETPPPQAGNPSRPVCDHGITHLCLQVTDIEAEYARLLEAGMHFHCPPQRVGGSVCATYGRDPDGNVVELLEVPADSALAVVSG